MEVVILGSIALISVALVLVKQASAKNLLLLAIEVLTALLCHFHQLHTLAFSIFLLALLSTWSFAVVIARFSRGNVENKFQPSFVNRIAGVLVAVILISLVIVALISPFQLSQTSVTSVSNLLPGNFLAPIAGGIVLMVGLMTLVTISNRKEK